MTLFFVRKRFGNLNTRILFVPITILLIASFIYLIRIIEFDFKEDLVYSLMFCYLMLINFLCILIGVIFITGFKGVSVYINSREIEYYDFILGFHFRSNKYNIELSDESYILMFNTNYKYDSDYLTEEIETDGILESFYEVSIVDANYEKLQILETTSYKEARESAYKLSKFLEIELKDRIKGE